VISSPEPFKQTAIQPTIGAPTFSKLPVKQEAIDDENLSGSNHD
jgi:hypothetical protein